MDKQVSGRIYLMQQFKVQVCSMFPVIIECIYMEVGTVPPNEQILSRIPLNYLQVKISIWLELGLNKLPIWVDARGQPSSSFVCHNVQSINWWDWRGPMLKTSHRLTRNYQSYSNVAIIDGRLRGRYKRSPPRIKRRDGIAVTSSANTLMVTNKGRVGTNTGFNSKQTTTSHSDKELTTNNNSIKGSMMLTRFNIGESCSWCSANRKK